MSDDNVIKFPSAARPPSILRIADVDLEQLAMAMNDNDAFLTWLFDPATGEVIPQHEDVTDDDADLDTSRLVSIDSEGSREAYRDMERFASWVGDQALSRRLQRALEGRGAFRRFRDELHSMPDFYAKKWHEYSNLRDEERAIDWLRYHDVVDPAEAERESAERERMAVAVLDEIEAQGGLRVDVADVPARWTEIVAAVEGGSPVTVVRDNELFAVIARGD